MTVLARRPAAVDSRPRGVVRVGVTSDSRRVDLAVPAAVPVADLLPELARAVGLLDPATIHGGYRLVARDGRTLTPDAGLDAQGVEDGDVLTVAGGADLEPPRLYDDPAEAMGDAVARDVACWDPASARRAGLLVTASFLLLGACCLAVRRGEEVTFVGLQVGGVLVAAAVLLSRVVQDTEAAVTCALLGCTYAGVAGTGSPSPASALVVGGMALLLAGVGSCLGLAEGRVLLVTPILVGATALGAGLAVRATACDPAVVLAVVLVLVVLAGHGMPWLALRLAQARGRHVVNAVGIDPRQIAVDARIAHQLLVAGSAAAGAIVVLLAPAAVALGVDGTITAVLACVLVVTRAGRQRARLLVELDLWSGLLGLLATILGTTRFHPDWPFAVTGALLATGLVVPRLALAGAGSGAHRLAVAVEAVAVAAIVPVLTSTTGLLSLVAG